MSADDDKSAPVISTAVAIGLVLVSILSAIAYFALQAYAPDFREGDDAAAHALSKSAIGFAGLRVLLEADGVPNRISRGEEHERWRGRSLLILTPPGFTDAKEIKSHAELPFPPPAGQGAAPRPLVSSTVLIVLPKWFPLADPASYGRVLKGERFPREALEGMLGDLSKTTRIARRPKSASPGLATEDSVLAPLPAPLAAIDSLQTISGPDWEPMIEAGKGEALLARLKGKEIYVLADPDVMNTQGLDDLPTAALALAIVKRLRDDRSPVVFDVTLNGLGREPSLLRAMFSPPFLGATLCAILAALLIGFHGAVRFGAPQRAKEAYARGKAALVSNAAELIRMLHREPRMAARYAQTTRNLTIRALGVRRKLDADEAEALFKALESEGGPAYAALLAEANQVNSRAGLVALARKFYDWRQGMLHAR